jgi:hypothetical protein
LQNLFVGRGVIDVEDDALLFGRHLEDVAGVPADNVTRADVRWRGAQLVEERSSKSTGWRGGR